MFEGNTISLKDNNVTLLSKKSSCTMESSTISWKGPFDWKCIPFIWSTSFTYQTENCLSCPLCLKVAPILWKECYIPFKEAQLQSIWKGTPLNWRKCFTHQKKKIAHPKGLHPLNGKLHIPKEYCACLSYKHFLK